MNVVRCNQSGYQDLLQKLTTTSSLFNPEVESRAREIIDAVYTRGDAALLEFTERFDGARLMTSDLAVSTAEFMNASLVADESLRTAVAKASKNIEFFSRRSLRKAWSGKN